MIAVLCTLTLLGLTAAVTRWSITRLAAAGQSLAHVDPGRSAPVIETLLEATDGLRTSIDARGSDTSGTAPERVPPGPR